MALSQPTRFLSSSSVVLLAALPLGLCAAKPAHGQTTPAITPGTRIFRATMILESNLRQQKAAAQQRAVVAPAYHRPHRTGPAVRPSTTAQMAPVTIVIAAPPPSPLDPRTPTQYATIRGPKGDVRRFPLARGQDTIQPRSITVRAGESVTLQILAAAPATPTPKR